MAVSPVAAYSEREIEIARLVLAKKRLRDFVQQSWHVLEPTTEFKSNWHIDCVADHLEAMTRGEIKNLILNVPPGSMKSMLAGVFWPAWEWIQNPGQRWLYGAYKETFAFRDSQKTRRLIASDWYQSRFGHIFQIRKDQDAKGRFENDKTGIRVALGIHSATGERCGRVIWDDPHNIEEVESDIQRQQTIDAWRSTWSSRIADPETSTRLVIMQRLHQADVSGYLLEQGWWEHLTIPMEFEGAKALSHGWTDPRTVDGELLWPHHFTPEENAQEKITKGPYGYAGQFQQRPAPREGGLFKEEWFRKVDAIPVVAHRVRAWDNASTQDGGDYTVGVLMAKSLDGLYWIEDVVRGQWSAAERDRIKRETAVRDAEKYASNVRIWDVQDPGSAGKDAAAASVRNLAGYAVRTEFRSGSKESNADPFASQCGAGNVRMLKAEWNRAYVDEMATFPNGKFDDVVDSSSFAFAKLAPMGAFASGWKKKMKLNFDLGFGKAPSRKRDLLS